MRCLISQDLLLNWLMLHLDTWPVTCGTKTLYLTLALWGSLEEKKISRLVRQNYWFNSINVGQPRLQTRVITMSEGSEMRLSHFLRWHLCVMSVRPRNVLKLLFLCQLLKHFELATKPLLSYSYILHFFWSCFETVCIGKSAIQIHLNRIEFFDALRNTTDLHSFIKLIFFFIKTHRYLYFIVPELLGLNLYAKCFICFW